MKVSIKKFISVLSLFFIVFFLEFPLFVNALESDTSIESPKESFFIISYEDTWVNNIDGGTFLFQIQVEGILDGEEPQIVSIIGKDSVDIFSLEDKKLVEEIIPFHEGVSEILLTLDKVLTNEDALAPGVYELKLKVGEVEQSISFTVYKKISLLLEDKTFYNKKGEQIKIISSLLEEPTIKLFKEEEEVTTQFKITESELITLEYALTDLSSYIGTYTLFFKTESSSGSIEFSIEEYIPITSIHFSSSTYDVLLDSEVAENLEYTLEPSRVTEDFVTWNVLDSSIAEMQEDGTLKLKSSGTTEVRVCSLYDATVCGSYELRVKNPSVFLEEDKKEIQILDTVLDTDNQFFNYQGGTLSVPFVAQGLEKVESQVYEIHENGSESLIEDIASSIKENKVMVEIPSGRAMNAGTYKICVNGIYTINGEEENLLACVSFLVDDYVPIKEIEFSEFSGVYSLEDTIVSLPELLITSKIPGETPTFTTDYFTYTSSNEEIATITSNGIVTLNGKEGSTIITVTSTKESLIHAQFYLHVVDYELHEPDFTIKEEEIEKDEFLIAGYGTSLHIPFNKALEEGSYEISKEGISLKRGTITEDFLEIEIPSTYEEGEYSISITNLFTTYLEKRDGTKEKVELAKNEKEYSFYLESPITKIESVSTKKILVGEEDTLEYTFTPSRPYSEEVLFESSDSSVVSVDADGKITALQAGSAIITITSKYQRDIKTTVTVSVLNPGGNLEITETKNYMKQEGFTGIPEDVFYSGHRGILRGSFSFTDMDSVTFKTTYEGEETSAIKVTPMYSSFTGEIAGEIRVDLKGTEASGTYCIQAIGKVTDNLVEEIEKEVCFTVEPFQAIDTLAIYKEETQIQEEVVSIDSEDYDLEVLLNNGEEIVTYPEVKWESSNESVATISKGRVHIVGRGTTVITVTSLNQPDKKATYTLKVVQTEVSIENLRIEPDNSAFYNIDNSSLYKGSSGTIKLDYSFVDSNRKEVHILKEGEEVNSFFNITSLEESGTLTITMKETVEEGTYCVSLAGSYDAISSATTIEDFCFTIHDLHVPNKMFMEVESSLFSLKDTNTVSLKVTFDEEYDSLSFKEITWSVEGSGVHLADTKENENLLTIVENNTYTVTACLDKGKELCVSKTIKAINTDIYAEITSALGDNRSLYNVEETTLFEGMDGLVKGTYTVVDATNVKLYLEDKEETPISYTDGAFELQTKTMDAGTYCIVAEATYEEGSRIVDSETLQEVKNCFTIEPLYLPSSMRLETDRSILPFLENEEENKVHFTVSFDIPYEEMTFKDITWSATDSSVLLEETKENTMEATFTKPGTYTIEACLDKGVSLACKSQEILVVDTTAHIEITSALGDNTSFYNMEEDKNIYHAVSSLSTSTEIYTNTGYVEGIYSFKDATETKIYIKDTDIEIPQKEGHFSYDASVLEPGEYCIVAEAIYKDETGEIISTSIMEEDSNCFVVHELILPASMAIEAPDYYFVKNTERFVVTAKVEEATFPTVSWNITGEAATLRETEDNHEVIVEPKGVGTVRVEACLEKGVNKCHSVNVIIVNTDVEIESFQIEGSQTNKKEILYDAFGGNVKMDVKSQDVTREDHEGNDRLKVTLHKDSEEGEVVEDISYTLKENLLEVSIPKNLEVGEYCFVLTGEYVLHGTVHDQDSASRCFTIEEYIPVENVSFAKEKITLGSGHTKETEITITENASFKDFVTYRSSNLEVVEVSNDGKITGIGRGEATIVATVDGTEASMQVQVLDAVGRLEITKITGLRLENENLIYDIGGGSIEGAYTLEDTNRHQFKIYSNEELTIEDTTMSIKEEEGTFRVVVPENVVAGTYYLTLDTSYEEEEEVISSSRVSIPFVITPFIQPSTLFLSETSGTKAFGETFSLQATVGPVDVSNKNVVWSISDTSIVQFATSAEGNTALFLVTGRGEATITATSSISSAVYATYTLNTVEAEFIPGSLHIVSNDIEKGENRLFFETGGKITTSIEKFDITSYEITVKNEEGDVVPEIPIDIASTETQIDVEITVPATIPIGKYIIEITGRYDKEGIESIATPKEITFLVEEYIPYIDVLEGSPYSLESEYSETETNYIVNVNANTEYSTFIEQLNLDGSRYTIYKVDGSILSSGGIGTGYRLEVSIGGNVQNYIIIVTGDVNSDGTISALDYIRVRNHIMDTNKIANVYQLKGADANKDGNISSLDYIRIRNIIMNTGGR